MQTADSRLPRNAQAEKGAHASARGSCSARCWTGRLWSSSIRGAAVPSGERRRRRKLHRSAAPASSAAQAPRQRRAAGRFLDGPDAVAVSAGDDSADGPAGAGLRAGPAHARRVHPRRPGHHPAQAARQGEGPEDGRDEDGRHRIRRAHGGTGEAANTPSRTASSSIPRSTPLPTGIRGWARRTSGPSPSRARCSRSSARSPTTSATTNCSAPRACCCGT